MGTTQRIIPGVTGEPNWGSLTSSITAMANAVGQELAISDDLTAALEIASTNPSEANKKNVDGVIKRQHEIIARRQNHFNSSLSNLIKTGGGRDKVASGKSASLGKAGLRSSKRISSFFISVKSAGLNNSLQRIGFNVRGKTLTEIVDFLLVHFTDTSSGMDEVAANMASCQLLSEIADGAKSIKEFEKEIASIVNDNRLTEILCKFFGLYLFEHLSQRFQEKITQMKQEAISSETFSIIKEDILGQVTRLGKSRDLSKVDWKGTDGRQSEESIFNSIIKIFE